MRSLLLALLLLSFVPSYCGEKYPFLDHNKRERFQFLTTQFRCLVCQNQDLASSSVSLAGDLRRRIYLMIQQNKSSDEIIDYLQHRYGDFILFRPPVRAKTFLLWFGPAFFLLIGLGAVFILVKK